MTLLRALHIKSVQSLNRRLKGWKAERKTEALALALSAFQPSSLLPRPAFSTLCAKPLLRCSMAALLGVALPAFAHVGSPNAFFDGKAGPYPIRVVVKQPGVVPGLADITVRTPPEATRVAVKPVKWDIGEAGSPPADEASRMVGDANAWTASLWLMSRGSYSIYVDVDGARGRGRAIVPVTAVATQRLPMPKVLSFLLAAMGALLVIGAISLVGAGAREAVLEPGRAVDTAHRRNGRIALGAGALIVLLLVARGNAWWNEVDAGYRKLLFKPLHIRTSVDRDGTLDLIIDDAEWRDHASRYTPFMPDHGKLMHLFLIREDRSAMAHLHPQMLARDHFRAAVTELPEGSYRVFADVTHESGFGQTLVDRLTVTGVAPAKSDPDDAAWTGGPSTAGPSAGGPVPVVMLSPLSIPANRDTDLRFRMPGVLEPYMGMPGHAVIASDDFSVFVHLHPMGSVSMASQMKFAERDKLPQDMSAMNMTMPMSTTSSDGTVSFPYAFPKRGRYHVWVQTKVNGQILTGAFVVDAK